DGDPMMFDYSEAGIYSEAKAKHVAWDRHYGRFWKASVLFCDQSQIFPSFIETQRTTYGFTPEAEPRIFNAVTGRNLSFADGMDIGRRIWNLSRAIWVLQGRHRDLEQFAGFMYKPGAAYGGCGTTTSRIFVISSVGNLLPVFERGEWRYDERREMYLDRHGVEQLKTNFFKFEGWDPASGWPRRSTLEKLDLKHVADELAAHGKLGA
ncbi:MAG: aldehyde ferredoxin oxidoreductase C-terminal domain-containing protein, partial [Planctomycetota bacterium]